MRCRTKLLYDTVFSSHFLFDSSHSSTRNVVDIPVPLWLYVDIVSRSTIDSKPAKPATPLSPSTSQYLRHFLLSEHSVSSATLIDPASVKPQPLPSITLPTWSSFHEGLFDCVYIPGASLSSVPALKKPYSCQHRQSYNAHLC